MKRILAMVVVFSLVLGLGAFSALAADNGEITITTGAEYVEKIVSANFGSTFIIEGAEDTDGDGEADGIILPDTYQVSGFYGTIIGVDGKNTIYIPGTKSMFATVGEGETEISNLILKGNTIKAPAASTHTGALISNVNNANSIVTIDGITNYVNLSDNLVRYLNMGGIVGNVSNTGITIRNCVNYGAISISRQYMAAGGILGGSSAAKTITIENCANYGTITGAKSGSSTIATHLLGGIYGGTINGNTTTTPEEKIVITGCANYADITSSGAASLYVAGITARVYNAEISKCFNAGEMVSTAAYAAGICIQWDSGSSIISDCFNVGVIKNANSSASYNSLRAACGIVSTHEDNRNGAKVVNCYNAGDMTQRSDAKLDSTLATHAREITGATGVTTSYQINDEDKDYYITIESLAAGLPNDFSSDVWEYVETSEENKYSLPQIKGNTFVTTSDAWYVEPVVNEEITFADAPLTFSGVADSSYAPTTESGEAITGGYSVVAARFALPSGVEENDVEYGMLISKRVSGEDLTAETCTQKAKALRSFNGAYGILFYGNMVDGDTYYVRPYVKYNDTYTYGDPSSFVFDAE